MFITRAIALAVLLTAPAFAEDPLHTAMRMNDQAMAFVDQGKWQDAENLYRSALDVKCDELMRARIANNLALLYRSEDRYPDAEAALRHALDWRQKNLPAGSVEIAYSLNNLADVYRIQGRDWEARNLFESALKILGGSGPDNVGFPVVASNLAVVLCKFNEYDRAEDLLHQALTGMEREHGAISREVGVASNNLAQVFQAKKKLQEAAEMYRRAVDIFEALGPATELDLAAVLANRGELFEEQHQNGQAEQDEQRALDLLNPQGNGPLRAAILQNLGNILAESPNPKDALPYFEQSLQVQEKALGSEHPATVRLLLDYSAATLRAGQEALSRKLRKRAQALFKRIQSTDPGGFTVSLNSLRDVH